jgi:hypothetical protein
MTPKEKAEGLFNKYYLKTESGMDKDFGWVCISLNKGMAKSCALIAVDEIIKDRENLSEYYWIDLDYWQQVKHEIEIL